jgi:hypothetical protein
VIKSGMQGRVLLVLVGVAVFVAHMVGAARSTRGKKRAPPSRARMRNSKQPCDRNRCTMRTRPGQKILQRGPGARPPPLSPVATLPPDAAGVRNSGGTSDAVRAHGDALELSGDELPEGRFVAGIGVASVLKRVRRRGERHGEVAEDQQYDNGDDGHGPGLCGRRGRNFP